MNEETSWRISRGEIDVKMVVFKLDFKNKNYSRDLKDHFALIL
jgi:hypothetical protein